MFSITYCLDVLVECLVHDQELCVTMQLLIHDRDEIGLGMVPSNPNPLHLDFRTLSLGLTYNE